MKKLALMALALGAISVGPISASADPDCGTAPQATVAATIPLSQAPIDQGDVYVTDAPGLWQESNDQAGLQTAAKDNCWAADTDLTAAPSDVPPVPGDVPPLPGDVPPLPGDVPPVPGDVPPVPGDVPDPGSLPVPELPV